jgi:hypothetical protein
MPDDGQGPPEGPTGTPPSRPDPPGRPSGPPPPSRLPPPPGSTPPGPGGAAHRSSAGADLRVGGRLLPIRPMSVGDVLDGAFSGLRATFVPVAIIVVSVLGPLQLLLNLVLSRISPELAGAGLFAGVVDLDDALGAGAPGVFGVSLLFSLISVVVTLIASGGAVELLLQADRGEPTDVGRSLRGALAVFWPLLGASLLLALGGFAASIGLVLLGVLLGTVVPVVGPILVFVVLLPAFVIGGAAIVGAYGTLVPIAVTERRGPIATVGRALWVLRTRFWRLVGITLLIGLLAVIATAGLQLPFVFLGFVAGPFGWIATSVGEILGQLVVVPITAFGATLVYLDARVRHEGLDLQLRTRGVDDA